MWRTRRHAGAGLARPLKRVDRARSLKRVDRKHEETGTHWRQMLAPECRRFHVVVLVVGVLEARLLDIRIDELGVSQCSVISCYHFAARHTSCHACVLDYSRGILACVSVLSCQLHLWMLGGTSPFPTALCRQATVISTANFASEPNPASIETFEQASSTSIAIAELGDSFLSSGLFVASFSLSDCSPGSQLPEDARQATATDVALVAMEWGMVVILPGSIQGVSSFQSASARRRLRLLKSVPPELQFVHIIHSQSHGLATKRPHLLQNMHASGLHSDLDDSSQTCMTTTSCLHTVMSDDVFGLAFAFIGESHRSSALLGYWRRVDLANYVPEHGTYVKCVWRTTGDPFAVAEAASFRGHHPSPSKEVTCIWVHACTQALLLVLAAHMNSREAGSWASGAAIDVQHAVQANTLWYLIRRLNTQLVHQLPLTYAAAVVVEAATQLLLIASIPCSPLLRRWANSECFSSMLVDTCLQSFDGPPEAPAREGIHRSTQTSAISDVRCALLVIGAIYDPQRVKPLFLASSCSHPMCFVANERGRLSSCVIPGDHMALLQDPIEGDHLIATMDQYAFPNSLLILASKGAGIPRLISCSTESLRIGADDYAPLRDAIMQALLRNIAEGCSELGSVYTRIEVDENTQARIEVDPTTAFRRNRGASTSMHRKASARFLMMSVAIPPSVLCNLFYSGSPSIHTIFTVTHLGDLLSEIAPCATKEAVLILYGADCFPDSVVCGFAADSGVSSPVLVSAIVATKHSCLRPASFEPLMERIKQAVLVAYLFGSLAHAARCLGESTSPYLERFEAGICVRLLTACTIPLVIYPSRQAATSQVLACVNGSQSQAWDSTDTYSASRLIRELVTPPSVPSWLHEVIIRRAVSLTSSHSAGNEDSLRWFCVLLCSDVPRNDADLWSLLRVSRTFRMWPLPLLCQRALQNTWSGERAAQSCFHRIAEPHLCLAYLLFSHTQYAGQKANWRTFLHSLNRWLVAGCATACTVLHEGTTALADEWSIAFFVSAITAAHPRIGNAVMHLTLRNAATHMAHEVRHALTSPWVVGIFRNPLS